jgi:hypothetical protein
MAELEEQTRAAMARGDWVTTAQLQIWMDYMEHEQDEQPVPMISAALWYAQMGLKVFPCWPNVKEPATPHGFQDATTDEEIIRSWWAFSGADFNIGIATGHVVDVWDVDPIMTHLDRPSGLKLWAMWLEAEAAGQLMLPPIWGVVSTVRPGATHYYVPASGRPSETGHEKGDHPGIDFKAAGGYVVAPPSVVNRQDEGGNYLPGTGVRYRWRHPLQLPAEETARAN